MEKNNLAANNIEMNNEVVDEVVEVMKNTVSTSIDATNEISKIVSITPKSGYDKKIELISNAQDMSTKEKISAINDAEDKYSDDLAKNADTYKDLLWTKAGVVLGVTAGLILMTTTPGGRKFAKKILKKIA